MTTYTHAAFLVADAVGYLTYGTADATATRASATRSSPPTRCSQLGGHVLHDDDLAQAITDCVLERGRRLTLDGPSMRTKDLALNEHAPMRIKIPAKNPDATLSAGRQAFSAVESFPSRAEPMDSHQRLDRQGKPASLRERKCPECGRRMLRKSGAATPFWACSMPNCKGARPLRVMLLCADYKYRGGVADHAHDLAFALTQARPSQVFVDVIARDKIGKGSGLALRRNAKGAVVEWLVPPRSVEGFSGRGTPLGAVVEQIAQSWTATDPDILHAHDLDSLVLGSILQDVFAVPLVLTLHHAPKRWYPGRHRLYAKEALLHFARQRRLVRRVFTPSDAAAKPLREQGFKSVEVVPHGVSIHHKPSFPDDPDYLTANGISPDPSQATVVFCPVRPEADNKSPDLFIRGAVELYQRWQTQGQGLPPMLFVMSTGWDDKDNDARLIRMASALGLPTSSLRFLPYVERKLLGTIYRRSSLVVIPSLRESFGLSVLDAFLFKRPVLVRAEASLPELVRSEESGMLFDGANDMADHAIRLLTDVALRNRCVDGATAQLGTKFTPVAMAKRYLDAYGAVLDECRSRPKPHRKDRARRMKDRGRPRKRKGRS